MNLRGINFFIFVASGALNFFGEGWRFHKLYKRIFPKGFDFSGATFVSKTTTLNERKGNMELAPISSLVLCFPIAFGSIPSKESSSTRLD